MRRLSALVLLAGLAPGATGQEVELVGDVPYVRLETRELTREHMLDQLEPARGRWGNWYLATPFPYAGHGTNDLATPHAPEDELGRMTPGGPGPDLSRVFTGKTGIDVRWERLGFATDTLIQLNVHDDPELHDEASCYLYATVEAQRAIAAPVTMGSDDGLRFWLNGELLVDVDVARGLDPHSESVTLSLQPGVNHVLVKVTEGGGDWAYMINTRRPLGAVVDARLHQLLDRDFPPAPDRAYYAAHTFPIPEDVVLEVGGLAHLADGRPVVTTRRGDVLIVEGAYEEPPFGATFKLFASGLHEPLGVAVRADADGEAVYTVQRGELTRLRDVDGDDVADVYETFSDGWGVSGNYHEFAFGPVFDRDGNAWVTLNLGFCGSLGKAIAPWRGWALKITPQGEVIPVCDGLRSPNGIGRLAGGEMVYVDNQGDFVATNRLSVLAPGSWHGHPASLRWREGLAGFDLPEGYGLELEQEEDPADAAVAEQAEAAVDPYARTDTRPARQPASIWFPYKKMGQSAADIVLDDTGGAFGPFAGQLFVGDQTLGTVMRVHLEQVDGHFQGACFPFVEALDCGVNRLHFLPDGSLLVGQTDRGWASVGRRPYGLQRIVWRGEVPFEILSMEARPDGFLLTFTRAVDGESATDPGSYSMSSYTYEYHADYGAPEDDTLGLDVLSATMVDETRVHLVVEPLRTDHVHELHAEGVRSADDPTEGLVHAAAYYTLIRLPGDGDR